jgi:hypothetical protein
MSNEENPAVIIEQVEESPNNQGGEHENQKQQQGKNFSRAFGNMLRRSKRMM